MNAQEFLVKMNDVQNHLLDYIDDVTNDDEKFKKLITLLNEQKIQNNKYQLTSVIRLLASIIDYHYRTINFYDKIFAIILFLKESLMKYFSNFEIFNFFKKNKRILLFLSEEKIIKFDELIVSKFQIFDHSISQIGEYLLPEIKFFLDEKTMKYLNVPKNLEELRKKEYEDNNVLQMIQHDLLDEFITYINKTDFKLEQDIRSSILETNIFLTYFYSIKPIEYAAFFGSVKIFKYLFTQKCSLGSNIWLLAIHGRNPEIIHILEDNHIQSTDDQSFKNCLEYAIKCHHNELVEYLLNNYVEIEENSSYILKKSLKYYNFALIQHELINSSVFYELCRMDYFILANAVLKENKDLDINSRKVEEVIKNEKTKTKEQTALFAASKKGNFDIVQLLLNHKDIDVNKKSLISHYSSNELTPLYAAITSGNIKIVQSLLDCKDIDINLKSFYQREQQTPLFTAIKNKNVEVVHLLIKRNDIDINLRSLEFEEDLDECTLEYYRDITSLYQAVECGNFEIVKLLLGHKDIDVNAIANIKIDQYYLSTGERYEPSYTKETAIFRAVYTNNTNIVRLLLSTNNIDVSFKAKRTLFKKEEEFPLVYAAVAKRNPEIVKLILGIKNIDVNAKLISPELKSNEDNIWDNEQIESKKNDLKNSSRNYLFSSTQSKIYAKSPLNTAIDNNDVEIVQYLLQNENIDVNAKSFFKSYSYSRGYMGISSEKKKLTEMTPLYFAVDKGNQEIVQMLIDHKNININLKSVFYECDTNGFSNEENIIDKEETALHNAIEKGNLNIIESLLNHKNININITDKQGRKPIMLTNKKEIKLLFKRKNYH